MNIYSGMANYLAKSVKFEGNFKKKKMLYRSQNLHNQSKHGKKETNNAKKIKILKNLF